MREREKKKAISFCFPRKILHTTKKFGYFLLLLLFRKCIFQVECSFHVTERNEATEQQQNLQKATSKKSNFEAT